ncbi:hypothetical protein ABRT01_05895 [Lentibacillus sp. L22]|uniref:hypothetical protein n=1 Tax=Lentibacillus sp. L22 TaxID=3163028 RepID=UPI0034677181
MKNGSDGLAFVGCVVLGSGIGMLAVNPGAGGTIGVGAGFLAMALMRRKQG